jgi:hypothetical protein
MIELRQGRIIDSNEHEKIMELRESGKTARARKVWLSEQSRDTTLLVSCYPSQRTKGHYPTAEGER